MGAFDTIRTPLSADELKETAEALRLAVSAATATVVSPDGAVEVTAGPGNAIVALGFSRAAYRLRPERLGALVVETVRHATAEATATIADSVDALGRGRVELPGLLGGALPALPPPEPPALTDPLDEANAADATLRRLDDEARQQLKGYAELRAALAELTATARSDDGCVAVTVRAGGELLAVHIGDDALRHDPATLAGIVHATVMTATARAAVAMAERVQQLTGPHLDVRSMVAKYQPDKPDDAGGR